MDDNAKAEIDFHARISEKMQKQNKLIQDKDAQLDDLREMNASLIKENQKLKLGKTTKLPTQDTNKPKEPSWWKEKERMDNRNKPKKPPGSKGYHNGAFYKPLAAVLTYHPRRIGHFTLVAVIFPLTFLRGIKVLLGY